MPSLRSLVCQLFARVLIAALVVTSLPPLAPASAARTLLPGHIHADGLGSIRRLTDETGNITDGYTYSAFGELLAHTVTDPQPYAFAGEPYDPNVGFQYHRARWMDPRVGRFTSADPIDGVMADPLTLHKYAYAGADPANKIDPSGESFVSVITVAASITILAGIGLNAMLPRSERWIGGGVRVLALQWQNQFTMPVRVSGRVISVPLDQSDADLVKLWTRQQLHMAFSGLAVVISEGGGTNLIQVTQSQPTGEAGMTPRIGFSRASLVNYDHLAGLALGHSPPGVSKDEYLASLGRGIGATAAHEFVHQAPINIGHHSDRRFQATYDFYTADHASHFSGNLGWSPEAQQLLYQRLRY